MHTRTISILTTREYVLAGILAVALLTAGIVHADALNRQLQVGMSGSDVSVLQQFLATDPTLYPQGLVTGYFGSLTSAAVSNFQTRNGISAVGRVGPATLPVLNLQIASGMTGDSGSAPVITTVGVNASQSSASIYWTTNESAKGVVYYSTSPLTTYENTNSVNVSGNTAMVDANFRSSQNLTISGLQSNTTYYYLIYTTDQQGNVSVTWPTTFHTSN